MKRTILILLLVFVISNTIISQYTQQGPKLVCSNIDSGSVQGPVAISSDGNTLVIGCPVDGNGTGAICVFTRSGGIWTQQGPKLVGTGSVSTCFQGTSVAISSDGNTV